MDSPLYKRKKNTLRISVKESKQIIFLLCKYCYSRNFKDEVNKSIIFCNTYIEIIQSSKNECFICKNFFLVTIPHIIKEIARLYNGSKFHGITIDTGINLPVFFYENEDFLRSLFKIKGLPNVKNHINTIIRIDLLNRNNYLIVHQNPDIKFEIIVGNNLEYKIQFRTKEIYLLGTYNKYHRGINQRIQKEKKENYADIKINGEKQLTVEDYIRKSLWLETQSTEIVTMWTGGEDKNSLVLGSGRPFIAKVSNPKIRNICNKYNWEKKLILKFKTIEMQDLQKYSKYRLYVKITVNTEPSLLRPIDMENIRLKFNGNTKFKFKQKTTTKWCQYLNYKILDYSKFEISLILDNGIPIKKLVQDEREVSPCLTTILNKKCECIYFDIHDVIMNIS